MEANTPINIWSLRTDEETLEHVETNTFWMNFTAVLFENFFLSPHTHSEGGDNDILEDERRYTVSWHFNIGVAPSGLTIACNAWSWIVQCSQSQVLHLLGTISSSTEGHAGVKHFNQKVSRREKCDLPKWCEISFNNYQLNFRQGCISCGILVSGLRARGVSSEHMENMEIFSCSPT